MIEPNYKVGDIVYLVDSFKLSKVQVDEIVIRTTKEKQYLEYTVVSLAWLNVGKKKTKVVPEAYLVKDFESARQAAITNLENGYQKVYLELQKIEKKDLEIVKEKE